MVKSLSKGSRLSGTARDKLAADLKSKYESGSSIRALAESTGRSYGFVHRMLTEAGVQLRGRTGNGGAKSTSTERPKQDPPQRKRQDPIKVKPIPKIAAKPPRR